MRTKSWLLAGWLVACGACAHASVQSNAPRDVRHGIRVVGPHAQAGTAFRVQLESPVDTLHTPVGQSFTARVTDALRDSSGAVVVPTGATLRGHLVSVGRVDSPRVRLQFDSIDTVNGPAALDATIRHADHQHYAGPVELRPAPTLGYFDSPFVYPFDYPYGVYGGGPWPWGVEPYRPSEVHLPAGSTLDLVLTRPLVPPGSRIAY